MKIVLRQLLFTLLLCSTLYLSWTLTSLQDFYVPSPWGGGLDGRCYVVTAFVFVSFIIIFFKNVQTGFKDINDLKLLIAGLILVMLWLVAFYWVRLAIISLMLMIMGSESTIWDFSAADLIVYIPGLIPLGLILYILVRLKRLRKRGLREN
jgi:hypothetical protein